MREGPTTERTNVSEDPTVEADEADPSEPGPGDSEGARPEPDDRAD